MEPLSESLRLQWVHRTLAKKITHPYHTESLSQSKASIFPHPRCHKDYLSICTIEAHVTAPVWLILFLRSWPFILQAAEYSES